MGSFFSKLNIRQMIIHFVAFWFFIFAFQTLSYLYDFKFLFVLPVEARMNDAVRMNTDGKIIRLAGFLGLILAYIISWLISLRRDWFWVNSVLILVIAYALKYFNLLGWGKLQKIFLLPGSGFQVNSVAFFIVNGLVMLLIGCFLLFSGKIMQFIDKGNANTSKA